MKHNPNNPGEKKISRTAACISVLIILFLLIAGGVFVVAGPWFGKNHGYKVMKAVDEDSLPDTFSGRVRSWLGLDAVESVLHPETAGNDIDLTLPIEAPESADSSAGTASSAADTESAERHDVEAPQGSTADTASGSGTGSTSGQGSSGQTADAAGTGSTSGTGTANTTGAADTSEKEEKKSTSPTKLQKKYIKAWENWHMRTFPGKYPLHNYNWKYLKYDDNGVLHYEGDDDYMIRRGIDVSEFQESIDWDKVKEAGYDFVFVRVAHRTMHTGDLRRDTRAIKNLKRAKAAGLDVGAYVFSQAVTKKEAREEAELCLKIIKESGVELTLPIVYDPEIVVEDYNARINYISGKQFTDDVLAFSEVIKEAGYTPALYANSSTETDILDMSRLGEDIVLWYADYNSTPEIPYDFTFWQYSCYGRVSGIDTDTDLNVWFIKK